MHNPEFEELRRRFNVLREQNEKLQGSIMVLQATAEDLNTAVEKLKSERDMYKKAFNTIFTSNIGSAWEKYPEEKKKTMTIENKVNFCTNQINLSKLYIRKKMEDRMEDTLAENQRLKIELVQANAKLADTEEKLRNASSFAGAGGVSNSLLNDDNDAVPASAFQNAGASPSQEVASTPAGSKEKVAASEGALFTKMSAFFAKNKAAGINKTDNKQSQEKPAPSAGNRKDSKPKDPRPQQETQNQSKANPVRKQPQQQQQKHRQNQKGQPGHGENNSKDIVKSPEQHHDSRPKAENTKPATNKNQAVPPSPMQHKVPTPPPASPAMPTARTGKNPISDKNTIQFWKRFNQASPEEQAQIKKQLPGLNALLDMIPLSKEVLLTIGATGQYVISEIITQGMALGYWSTKDANKIRRAVARLTGEPGQPAFIVQGQDIISVGGGRPTHTYLLSRAGEAWYAMTTKTDPLKSLALIQAKEQKSVPHATLIQKAKDILDGAGYETYTEVALPTKTTGEMSIADISANKGGVLNLRIECEMGNYDLPSYVFKFAKALEVSDRLLVCVPKTETKDKIKEAIKELIREHYEGIDKFRRQGKSFAVFTLRELESDPNLIMPAQKKGW